MIWKCSYPQCHFHNRPPEERRFRAAVEVIIFDGRGEEIDGDDHWGIYCDGASALMSIAKCAACDSAAQMEEP